MSGHVFIFSGLSKVIAIHGFARIVDAFASLLGKDMLCAKYKQAIGYMLCFFVLSSCDSTGRSHRFSMRQHVLAHYRFIDCDTLKYQAAQFLLDNMKYHTTMEELVSVPDSLELYRHSVDSVYYAFVKDVSMDDMPWDSINSLKEKWHAYIKEHPLPDATVTRIIQADANVVDADFLIEHIDNAFHMWRTSKYAKGLSFEDFKELLLPYRSVEGYGFLQTGAELHELFGKYLDANKSKNLLDFIDFYNTHICNLRDMGGKTTRQETAGVYDLYTRDFHDCVDIASYGCNILRSCGLPSAVEYNICYRSFEGRHYMVAVADSGRWKVFSPESSLPEEKNDGFLEAANVYRTTFAAQHNTPYFLHAKGEYVPPVLSDPCIKDVTSRLRTTTHLSLPFREKTTNHLAYLATFNRSSEGLLPVTWGEIKEGKVTFEHVIPGLLYFPIYYPGEAYRPFGEPFYVTVEGRRPVVHPIINVCTSEEDGNLLLTRKFPRKPNMIRVAEELVGGTFWGANKPDFSDAVVLKRITEVPLPLLQDLTFNRTGKYQYYRFQAPEEHPHANISMLEWLSPSALGYVNAMVPSRLHITEPKDTILLSDHYAKLLDEDSWDKMSWKAEYDGNMTTSPGAYPNITLWLKEPQVVTGVRFAPLNADNGIHARDCYELFYWDGGWRSFGTQVARYEYVVFPDVSQNKLYWLKNLTAGKEEMPFVVVNGQQCFVYDDVIRDRMNVR